MTGQYVGGLPDVSVAPPVSDMWPLVGGAATPPGVFERTELEAVQDGASWLMHATWRLNDSVGGWLEVDGVAVRMEDEEYHMQIPVTRVQPGELLRTKGPRIGWRPELYGLLRDQETRGEEPVEPAPEPDLG